MESPDADLCCPLCEYNLRGLVDPRCPECGFAFDWAELRAADRARHPYLFEHGGRRSLATLALTAWRDALPWRFWRDVTPANPVNLRRLVLYWAVVGLAMTALLLAPLPHGMVPAWKEYSPMGRVRQPGRRIRPAAGTAVDRRVAR